MRMGGLPRIGMLLELTGSLKAEGFSFPYHIMFDEQERAREYSRDIWRNGKWPKAKHDLQWLVDKFAPVPGWES